jgi:hypothetical protein
MKRKLSTLFAVTRSVEKIIVRTSCPWDVPKPVFRTTAKQPPSGDVRSTLVDGVGALDSGEDCRTLVPPNRTELRSAAAMSSSSCDGRSSIDSFKSGVDSPDSIASLTMQLPWTRSRSHGTPESSLLRMMDTRSPGSRSSDWISNQEPARKTLMV